jgi:hypothetical protein
LCVSESKEEVEEFLEQTTKGDGDLGAVVIKLLENLPIPNFVLCSAALLHLLPKKIWGIIARKLYYRL